MKKITLLFVFVLIGGIMLTAQEPPPPPDNPGTNNNGPVGGGVPVGSGIAVLVTFAACFGAKKAFDASKKQQKN